MSTGSRVESLQKSLTKKGWRKIILRMGYSRAVFLFTMMAALSSAMITWVIMTLIWWQGNDVLIRALVIATAIPLTVAPVAVSLFMKLLYELEELQNRLLELVHLDPLTKIYNRRYMMEHLSSQSDRSLRSREPMSLLIIDVDKFKTVNDCYGHATGDLVLQEIARVCLLGMRSYDVIARFGGEEFVVLLPNTAISQACDVAERIRENVANLYIQSPAREVIRVTISIGISVFAPPDPECKNLLSRADKALYQAKHNGRNQYSVVL